MLVICDQAERCPHAADCRAHGKEAHKYDPRFCSSHLCNVFKEQRGSRLVRVRAKCHEPDPANRPLAHRGGEAGALERVRGVMVDG